jgi:hypothetical protein
MLHQYIIGVGVFVFLSMAWVGVQRAWKKSFPDIGLDPDALAGRSGCQGCAKASSCHDGAEREACEGQEEMR